MPCSELTAHLSINLFIKLLQGHPPGIGRGERGAKLWVCTERVAAA